MLDGKAYSWKLILEMRRAQRAAERKATQPALFELREDHRPKSQQTAAGRYAEPMLFQE